jgi:Domain of unknown function (DUF5615)
VGKGIQFYLDEHIPKAVADGLRRRGIAVTRAQEVGLRRASDEEHLEFAKRKSCVLVTKDSDFLRLGHASPFHKGIVYFDQSVTIGEMVNALELVDETLMPAEMIDHVEYW